MNFIFHVIANPRIPTNPKYIFDAYTIKIIKFCKMMHSRGHIIHFYGYENASKYVSANFFHTILYKNELLTQIKSLTNNFSDPEYLAVGARKEISDLTTQLDQLVEPRIYQKIAKHYKPNDMILQFFTALSFPEKMINVAPSIGGGYWLNYQYYAFETEAYMKNEIKRCNRIPKIEYYVNPWFDPEEYIFTPENKQSHTYLYMARLSKAKGFYYFLNFTKACPEYNFWIAGGCVSYDKEKGIIKTPEKEIDLKDYPNVTYFGIVNGETKRKLLAEATALIQPTEYFEPCGWNVLEAMLSGTPVLVPNYGAFVDTVVDGVTGYLCKSDEWHKRMQDVTTLDPQTCRKHVIDNFNEEKAYLKYVKFFNSIAKMTSK